MRRIEIQFTCVKQSVRLPRRHAGPLVAIVHARKTKDGSGYYSDYYSREEAKELSQMIPDPNNLFDDSLSSIDFDWGASPSGTNSASRIFGGDLHSSLDESLYNDAYSEDYNSFRDPGPDAGPWFSHQSPVNSGLSLDEDIESLSDEAKAYRKWELEKGLESALDMLSYQLTHTINRYMISAVHGEIMEEIEIDDAQRGLDASPAAASTLPPWMRAVYRVQEDFDALNEQQVWAEDQMSALEQERVAKEIDEQVYKAVSFVELADSVGKEGGQLGPQLILEEGEVVPGTLSSLGAAPSNEGSQLDLLMGGTGLPLPSEPSELPPEDLDLDLPFLPQDLLPGAEGSAFEGDFEGEELTQGSAGYVDPLTRLPGLGAGQAAAGGSSISGSSAQQALDDMDAEFDRRDAAWDEFASEEDDALDDDDIGVKSSAGAGLLRRKVEVVDSEEDEELEDGDEDGGVGGGRASSRAAGGRAGRYARQYDAPFGAELDDELGAWWGDSSVDEDEILMDAEEIIDEDDLSQDLGATDDEEDILSEEEEEEEEGGEEDDLFSLRFVTRRMCHQLHPHAALSLRRTAHLAPNPCPMTRAPALHPCQHASGRCPPAS